MRCLDKSSLSASLKKSKISHEIDNKSVLRFAFNDTHKLQIGFHFVVMHKNGELQVFYWGPYAGNHVPQVSSWGPSAGDHRIDYHDGFGHGVEREG